MSNWMVPYDKLDDKQIQFIEEDTKKSASNIWIQGFAGSGKSVLLIHTILDTRIKEPNAKIGIIVFTQALRQLFIAGMTELKIPNNVQLMTYHQFQKTNDEYDYIFCDEVQDLTPSVLKSMKERSKKLILSGDENQSIYETDPQPKKDENGRKYYERTLLPSEINDIANSTSYPLDTIHRLTKSLIKIVSKFIPSMGMLTSKTNMAKKDVTVLLAKANDVKKEVEYVLNKASETVSNTSENVVILLPTHDEILKFVNIALELKNIEPWEVVENRWGRTDYRQLHNYLKSKNVDLEYIGNGYGDLYNDGNRKIIIMTYHSSKGLDYDNVFLPFLYERDSWFDEKVLTETVFMVGMTRSKLKLTLSYTGKLHHYIDAFEDQCTKVDIEESLTNSSSNKKDVDDFDF